jgi:hypothetical protein
MRACKSIVMMLCVATAVSASGCAVDTPDDDRSSETSGVAERSAEVVDAPGVSGPRSSASASGGTTNTDSSGRCCWGHCTSSNAFEFPFLTSGCRAAVVNECHRRGLAFDPNGDAWWGTC